MDIDIDIKISEEDAENKKCYTKHFSGHIGPDDNVLYNAGGSKKFQEFLDEFLSVSGQIIRQNLIGKKPLASEVRESCSLIDDIGDNELIYTIQLGKDKLFTGRIPIQDLAVREELSNGKRENEGDRWNRMQLPEDNTVVKYFVNRALEKYEMTFLYTSSPEHYEGNF